MAETTGDLIGDGWLSEPAIYRTDLDACRPAAALYPGSRARHWRLLSYELEGLAGTMLRADEETDAPELTYPLRASGYHAVSLGLMAESSEDIVVLTRLNGDASSTVLTCPMTDRAGRHRIRELFWKIADLSGQDLVIGQNNRRIAAGDAPGCVAGSPVRLAYVKLVPLTEGEVATFRADAARQDTRRLFGHNDAHGLHYATRPTEAGHIRRRIEMFRNTDFSRLYWECGMGDLLYYLGTAGRLPTHDGLDDFARSGDRLHRESWQILREQGIDPFRVAREHARDMGLEFHATYRPAGFRFPPDHDHFDHGDSFYGRHPELRGRGRDGRETPRISYAYPESRRFAVSLLNEVATDYDVDGICLAYNRRPPFSEFELPLIDSFQAEHGRDPRTLADDDETWLWHRCGVLTSFMREVRADLDEVARARQRPRIPVTAIVMRDAAENLYYGMDLQTWGAGGAGGHPHPLHVRGVPGQRRRLLGGPARSGLVRRADARHLLHAVDEPAAPHDAARVVPRTRRRAVPHRRGKLLLLGLHARTRQLHGVVECPAAPGPQGGGAELGGRRPAGPRPRAASADQPGRVGPVVRHTGIACGCADVRAFHGSPSLPGARVRLARDRSLVRALAASLAADGAAGAHRDDP